MFGKRQVGAPRSWRGWWRRRSRSWRGRGTAVGEDEARAVKIDSAAISASSGTAINARIL
jgi:hypothetical protein